MNRDAGAPLPPLGSSSVAGPGCNHELLIRREGGIVDAFGEDVVDVTVIAMRIGSSSNIVGSNRRGN